VTCVHSVSWMTMDSSLHIFGFFQHQIPVEFGHRWYPFLWLVLSLARDLSPTPNAALTQH
jgi:hypothetical protein